MNMTIENVALLISALGLGAVLNSVVKAVSEKRKIGADATSVLTAAARELVEPLRQELKTERAERAQEHEQHVRELKQEREQAAQLRAELDDALSDCRHLRDELHEARTEIEQLRAELSAARPEHG